MHKLLETITRIFGTEFNKTVLILVSGTTISQVFPIAAAPLLTRLYDPHEFGIFAIYFALVSIFSVIVCGRYELAITLPKSRQTSFHLTVLSIGSCLLVSVAILSAMLIFFSNTYTQGLEVLFPIEFAMLSTLGICFTGLFNSLYFWHMREKSFALMARSRILQNGAMVVFQLLLAIVLDGSATFLVLGHLLGQFFAVGVLFYFFVAQNRTDKKLKQRYLGAVAMRYIRFPTLVVFGHFINALAKGAPNLVFGAFYSTAAAGYVILTQRVVGSPVSIIGTAFGEAFQEQASIAYNKRGNCLVEYKSLLFKLVIIATPPFLLFTLFAPDLFELVFGANWRPAGQFAQILAPMFYLQFITSPVGAVFWIARAHRADFLWQLGLGIATAAALILGITTGDIMFTVALYSISYTLAYGVAGVMTFYFARGPRRG